MNILEEKIIPFEGLGQIKLLSSLDDVKKILTQNKIKYTTEYQSNKGCNPEVPWTKLCIDNSITLIFAKNKLFEIYCIGKFSGTLPNGIKLGMKMDEALRINSTLKFDDWNEDYSSDNGYWIEDNLDDNTILSISVFIKEILDDKIFFKYEWAA